MIRRHVHVSATSCCRIVAEMDRHTPVLVIEDRNEFKTRTERFEILPQRRNADVVRVFELGDRALGYVETTCEFSLADRFAVAKFVETNLLERVGPQSCEPLGRARASDNVLAEFGKLGTCHQINPSS